MDTQQKVDLLGESARFDLCRGRGGSSSPAPDPLSHSISYAIGPGGRRMPLLKVLQSSVCENDCAYCAIRSGRDRRRASFEPEELARLFDQMAGRHLVQGLFLSSGIYKSTAHATDRMLATVDLIRHSYEYKGYIHLKILPGADDASIEESLRLADRVSVNLEAPNRNRIGALSSTKEYMTELVGPLMRADATRRTMQRHVSMTTQFVVGAAQEQDRELLRTSSWLYRKLRLARVYYSAFNPIRDTPLENHPPTPGWREHRLYQADFLLRQYDYLFDELVFDESGDLPREADPKLMWSRQHPEFFPVELNRAHRGDLLRIPGVGPVLADRILTRRRQGTLREMGDAGLPAASLRRAAPYVLLNGTHPAYQLPMW